MKNYKILMFTGKGTAAPYIIGDCKRALERLGCSITEFPITRPMMDIRPVLRNIKPDFVFALDHTGVDDQVFVEEKIMCFSWFVDNPLYFINETHRSDFNIFAVTDKSYLPELKRLGFQDVFYLPLATDILRMRKSMRKKMRGAGSHDVYETDISFVGTLGKRYTEWEEERNIKFPSPQKELLDFLIKLKISNPNVTFSELFEYCDERFKNDIFKKLTALQRGAIELRIDMETSAYFREKYLKALKGYKVTVYGDEGWKDILPENYSFGGKIDYEKDVGALYRMAKVNLNVTRTQIQTGVNQRVLDIAATGSVFLTDYRTTTQEFFDCDISDLMYKDEEELKEKAGRLIKDDKKRKEIGEELYQSVYNQHTYDQRMREMLEKIKNFEI
ncbi:MAG: glycosyltransferase [Candidatus Aureabacteria bacterium]|nr:glycosyltransferase [Candidatus Auribacterota bacterium]